MFKEMKRLPALIIITILATLVVVILVGWLTLFRDNSSNSTKPPSYEVKITDTNYKPSNLKIKKGTVVSWKNEGQKDHTVTADDENLKGIFSDILLPGKTYTYTFNSTGTFPYHDAINNSSLKGKVTVTD